MTTEFQPTASSVSLSSEATQGGDDAPLPKWTNDAQPSLQPISQSTANNAQHGTPFSLLVGCAQAVGSRDYQQDTFTITDNGYLASHTDASTSAEATLPKHALLCVFDGHGSATYAEHAAGNIHRLVTEHPAFHSGNYPLALAQGFALEDRELFEEVHAEERRGGTTATVALIVDELLYIANVGDSRAVLAERAGEPDSNAYYAIRVSQDHKTSVPKERARLEDAQAIVARGRVHTKTHSLNMTRALGDFAFKAPQNQQQTDWVSSAPTIVRVSLQPTHDFLLLASDGLWDLVDDESAVEWVSDRKEEGWEPKAIAEKLVEKISGVRGSDNVTVMVVFFEWGSAGQREQAQGEGGAEAGDR